MSGHPQGLEDGRHHHAQTEPNMRTVPDPQESANEYRASISVGTVRNDGMENLGAPLHIEDSNDPTASEPNKGTEDSRKIPESRVKDGQGRTDHSRILETTPEMSNEDHLEYQPTETIQAATQHALRFPSPDYRDAQTQTEPVESKCRNAETRTGLREPAKELQKETLIATAPTLKFSRPDQGAVEQPKVRNRKRVPVQPNLRAFGKPQDFIKSQAEKKIATKSLSHTDASPIPQRSLPKSSTSPLSQKPEMLLAITKNKATLQTARESLPIRHTTLHFHTLIRVAAFMLASFLLYLLFYAELENMLGQILALLLFVLLSFVALCSDNE